MNNYSEKFLFILDIDGTLFVNNEKEIDKINHENLLRFLNKKNFKFTIATGRAFEGIKKILKSFELFNNFLDPVAIYNGAVVLDSNGRRIHRKWELNCQNISEILQIANKFKLDFYAYTITNDLFSTIEEKVYTNVDKSSVLKDRYNNLNVHYLDNIRLSNLKNVVAILLFGLSSNSNEIKKDIMQKLTNFSNSKIYGDRIEIISKEAHKGSALKYIANLHKWNKDDVVAIGDSYNDVEMIKQAGIGITVKNAPEEIKQIADYVCQRESLNGFEEAWLNIVKWNKWIPLKDKKL